MSDQSYVYAVARIRSKELTLLTAASLEQLLSAPDAASCLRFLNEKGWGTGEMSADQILDAEHKKTWEFIKDLMGGDISVFNVFLYANDYHNLKAAIKDSVSKEKISGIFMEDGTIPLKTIREAVEQRDFALLPERMRAAAREALDVLLKTRDGQLCDCIVDKAALSDILKASGETHEKILMLYGELTVASADIKAAVRAVRTKKDRAFMARMLAPCKTLDTEKLMDAAVLGMNDLLRYLESTGYSEAVSVLKESPSAFERWCDNLIIRSIRPEIHNPFGLGPLAAYILARENEIKTVRIVLSGKKNALPETSIRERVREMYV